MRYKIVYSYCMQFRNGRCVNTVVVTFSNEENEDY